MWADSTAGRIWGFHGKTASFLAFEAVLGDNMAVVFFVIQSLWGSVPSRFVCELRFVKGLAGFYERDTVFF